MNADLEVARAIPLLSPHRPSLFAALRRDCAAYKNLGGWYRHPGFWIVAVHRLGMWAHTLPFIFRIPVWVLYRLLRVPYFFYHVDLWAGADGTRIGPGLCLIHPTNIMIGRRVEIGSDCLIFHDVTLGTGQTPGNPRIGNKVDIYTGARVLGGITIGDRSMIGANCVVTHDVPPESIVLVAPSKAIPRSLSPVARNADRKADRKAAAGAEAVAPMPPS
ncbi:MAG: serine O-acetyltransferase [Bacteroidota bacterium]